MDILGHGKGPGALAALIHGMVGVSLDLYQFPVLDVGQHAAAAVASGAG